MRNAVRHLQFAALLLSIAAAGCSTQRIRVKVLRPAAVNLTTFHNLAIDDFAGPNGTDLSEDISIALSNSRNALTGEKNFTIVDRQNLDRILVELERQRGDLWDPETARNLGRLVGAAVLIHGRLETGPVTDQIQVNKYVDEETGEETLYKTRVARTNITAYIKATDTETGRVLDEVKYQETAERITRATNAEPPRIDHDSLRDEARRRVVSRYSLRVVPHQVHVDVTLYKDGDFPQLEQGNAYAQAGNWERAIDNYRAALERMTGAYTEYRYKALYNLGVAHSYTNRFHEARTFLQDAYAESGQNRMVFAELGRVDSREDEYRRLVEQGQLPGETIN